MLPAIVVEGGRTGEKTGEKIMTQNIMIKTTRIATQTNKQKHPQQLK